MTVNKNSLYHAWLATMGIVAWALNLVLVILVMAGLEIAFSKQGAERILGIALAAIVSTGSIYLWHWIEKDLAFIAEMNEKKEGISGLYLMVVFVLSILSLLMFATFAYGIFRGPSLFLASMVAAGFYAYFLFRIWKMFKV